MGLLSLPRNLSSQKPGSGNPKDDEWLQWLSGGRERNDIDDFSVTSRAVKTDFAPVAELHPSFGYRIERIIAAALDADSREELTAALAHDNIADTNTASVRFFDPEILWLRIAAVLGRTRGFGMRHVCRNS